MEIIVYVFSIFIALPFLAFFAAYFLGKKYIPDIQKAKSIAINITTFCLFISVSVLFQVVGDLKSGVFITFLIWAIIFSILVLLQWKLKNQVDIEKSLKGSLRLWFIALWVCYIALFIIGITKAF